jgi:hypothetical protein
MKHLSLVNVIALLLTTALTSNGEVYAVPKSELIGTAASYSIAVLQQVTNGENSHPVYPDTVEFDIKKEIVQEIRCIYSHPGAFSFLQSHYNQLYPNDSIAGFEASPVRIWRISSKGLVIQLSKDSDNEKLIRLIVTRIAIL